MIKINNSLLEQLLYFETDKLNLTFTGRRNFYLTESLRSPSLFKLLPVQMLPSEVKSLRYEGYLVCSICEFQSFSFIPRHRLKSSVVICRTSLSDGRIIKITITNFNLEQSPYLETTNFNSHSQEERRILSPSFISFNNLSDIFLPVIIISQRSKLSSIRGLYHPESLFSL